MVVVVVVVVVAAAAAAVVVVVAALLACALFQHLIRASQILMSAAHAFRATRRHRGVTVLYVVFLRISFIGGKMSKFFSCFF